MFDSTNWLAVLVATLATQGLGFIWFNPKVFGTAWARGAGIDIDPNKATNMGLILLISTVMAFVSSTGMSLMVHPYDKLPTYAHGAYHGMMEALFYVVPFIVMHSLYEMKKPIYLLIVGAFTIAAMALQGAILFSWVKETAEVVAH